MISYAQNLEDVLLARAFRDTEAGFYIDVGAMHPVFDSVTKHFYDRGWHGINVEPAALHHALLEEQRPRDLNLRVALGEQPGRALLHRVGTTGLSSLDAAVAATSATRGEPVEDEEVEVTTLAELCRRHVSGAIDFLKIDVEGFEEAVIRGGDWQRFRPRVVVVEAIRPGSHEPSFASWDPLLRAADYDFAFFDGLNRFYVRHESAELLAHFQAPVNVLDDWLSHRTVVAEAHVAALLAEQLAQLERRARKKQSKRIGARLRRAFGRDRQGA
jgi:FkbM family methyltransferase